MASVDNISRWEVGVPGIVRVRCQLTATGTSTYVVPLSKVRGFVFSVEGTNATTATRSGQTITITGTDDDYVNIEAWGDM